MFIISYLIIGCVFFNDGCCKKEKTLTEYILSTQSKVFLQLVNPMFLNETSKVIKIRTFCLLIRVIQILDSIKYRESIGVLGIVFLETVHE